MSVVSSPRSRNTANHEPNRLIAYLLDIDDSVASAVCFEQGYGQCRCIRDVKKRIFMTMIMSDIAFCFLESGIFVDFQIT